MLWPGLPFGEAVRRRLESERALRSERRPGVEKWVSFLLGQAFRSVIGSPFWPVVPILGPAHELRIVCLDRAFVGKPVHVGHWVYEPDRSP